MRTLISDPVFLRGLFYITLVAIVITIFELVFFITFIGPKETSSIHNYFNNFIKNVESSKNHIGDANNGLNNYIDVFIDREKILDDKINNDAVSFIILEVIILCIVLYMIYNKLYRVTSTSIHGHDLGPVIITSVITVSILALFQINMYLFGKDYSYAGSDEIENLIYEQLLNAKNTKDKNT